MQKKVGSLGIVVAALCLAAWAFVYAGGGAKAQDEGEGDLMAKQRVFAGVGPGLRAVKRGMDGRLYILASPSPGLLRRIS